MTTDMCCPYCNAKMTHPNLTRHYCAAMVDALAQMLRDTERDIASGRLFERAKIVHTILKDELRKVNKVKGYEDI